MSQASLPIACNLTQGELTSRRDGLLPGLLSKAHSRETIPGGFRWSFSDSGGLVKEVASVIDAERGCCRFLTFRLSLEPDCGPLQMEITGPEGTQQFLLSLLSGIQR